jgi:uncharacterized repeat protein (TIGR03806 family)
MGRAMHWGGLALILLIGCGSDGPTGPALEPRPDTRTCLPDASGELPSRLSETGCFVDLKTLEPAPELIPYKVNSALWTDGAFKPRYMVIPNPERITIREDGSWVFPEGSILIKVFGFEFDVGDPSSRRPVETRFMVLRDGDWEFATYRWNDEATEAERLDPATDLTVSYTIHDRGEPKVVEYLYPSRTMCINCHGPRIDDVLGPKTAQLNRSNNYDGFVANQLVAMAEIDLFEAVTHLEPKDLPRMVNPQKGEGSAEEQARAYLDANCAHCHRPEGWASTYVDLDLRYETALMDTGLCEFMLHYPEYEGMPRIAPGDPEGSGLLQRFQREDGARMPPFGSSTVDSFGVEVISDWVRQMRACP